MRECCTVVGMKRQRREMREMREMAGDVLLEYYG